MAELKTKLTEASVDRFLKGVMDEQTRSDCHEILNIMKKATQAGPKMWGTRIVGFGSYHHKYASGREADWFVAGLSPRQQNIALYSLSGFDEYDSLLAGLGRFSTGKACLYIKNWNRWTGKR